MQDLTYEIETRAWEELTRVLGMGGSVEALGYMKERLVASLSARLGRVESGEQTVVGVNAYEEGEPSPLAGGIGSIERIEQATENEQIERLTAWRKDRDDAASKRALGALHAAALTGENLLPPSIEAARAGVTTGEWTDALREVFGEYRGPTGVSAAVVAGSVDSLTTARGKVAEAAARLGVQKVRLLVAKPGLDGHSNAAEQVAVRARDCGFEVIYQGIRLTPAQIARAAADEDVHAIGLSILSGGHMLLVPKVLECLRADGVNVPVVVGGIIPDEDAKELLALGVSRVFTPSDHDLTASVAAIAGLL